MLLFSFQNSLHEDFINQKLSEINLNLYKSISSQVLPEFREYERTSTVVVNSYVGPIIDKYLGNLEGKIENSNLRIMQSSGGAISSKQARNQPVRTMLSGPAGGVVEARDAFIKKIKDAEPRAITEGEPQKKQKLKKLNSSQ